MENKFLHLTTWPVYKHDNQLYTFDLWRKDLELYLNHIQILTILCPVYHKAPPSNCTAIDPTIASKITLVPVPKINRQREFIIGAWLYIPILIRQLINASVLHVIMVEQPIFYGILFPILKRFTKIKTVVFVESSSWRKLKLNGLFAIPWRFREMMCKRAVRNATVSFHTQAEYRNSLANDSENSYVLPAVWISRDSIVSSEVLEKSLCQRSQKGNIRLGYFGGIIYDKGPDLLIQAVIKLLQEGEDVTLDIYGKGPLQAECEELSKQYRDKIRFCGMLKYGVEFYSRIRQYDVGVVPSRSNEHLRITIDLLSQGVPVIASNVPGLTPFVFPNTNGLLFKKADIEDLAHQIRTMKSPNLRRVMAINAREGIIGKSHEDMHEDKAQKMSLYLKNIIVNQHG